MNETNSPFLRQLRSGCPTKLGLDVSDLIERIRLYSEDEISGGMALWDFLRTFNPLQL